MLPATIDNYWVVREYSSLNCLRVGKGFMQRRGFHAKTQSEDAKAQRLNPSIFAYLGVFA